MYETFLRNDNGKIRVSVFRSAYSILNDMCEAEDVAQEVSLAYYQSQEEFCSEEHL